MQAPTPSWGALLNEGQKYIDFIESGLVSLRALGPSDGPEVAMVGRHGMVGVSALLNERCPAHQAVVVIPGSTLRISKDDLRGLLRDQPQIKTYLLRHISPLLVHSAQNGLCGVHHPIEQRLASWLCLACDALNDTIVSISEDQLSVMLGFTKSLITKAVIHLEKQRSLRKISSGIEVCDRDILARKACDCHRVVTKAYKSARSC